VSAQGAAARSQARYARAAAVLPKIALGPAEAAALAALRRRGDETVSDLIRRLLREEAAR
jgi:hypothetical protein